MKRKNLVELVEAAADLVELVEAAADLVELVEAAADLVELVEAAADLVELVEAAADLVELLEAAADLVELVEAAADLVELVEGGVNSPQYGEGLSWISSGRLYGSRSHIGGRSISALATLSGGRQSGESANILSACPKSSRRSLVPNKTLNPARNISSSSTALAGSEAKNRSECRVRK